MRGLGLHTRSEWIEWAKTTDRPADIPAAARGVYAVDWRDWLGTEQRSATHRRGRFTKSGCLASLPKAILVSGGSFCALLPVS
jgi:hypothetical protein